MWYLKWRLGQMYAACPHWKLELGAKYSGFFGGNLWERAGGQIDGRGERAFIFHSHQCFVRPSVRVEPPPPPPPSGRGSHRSSDYRFPGGGPHRRTTRSRGRRRGRNGRRGGEPPMARRQPGRHHLSDRGRERGREGGWGDEGREDLGFAFLLWNGVNDAM